MQYNTTENYSNGSNKRDENDTSARGDMRARTTQHTVAQAQVFMTKNYF